MAKRNGDASLQKSNWACLGRWACTWSKSTVVTVGGGRHFRRSSASCQKSRQVAPRKPLTGSKRLNLLVQYISWYHNPRLCIPLRRSLTTMGERCATLRMNPMKASASLNPFGPSCAYRMPVQGTSMSFTTNGRRSVGSFTTGS